MKRLDSLVDIAAALALFMVAGLAVAWGAARLPTELRMPALVLIQGLLALAVVALFVAWRGQRWSEIGVVAVRARDLARGILALVGCLGANIVLVYMLHTVMPGTVEAHSERLGMFSRQLTAGVALPGLAAVLAFVGLYEEVFARGFLLARCRSLLGGTWAPVLVSSLLFGVGHLYQGWVGMAQTTLVGAVLALFTIRWGTVWPAVIAHALLDIASVAALSGLAVNDTAF